jgi:hypothetical protein
MKVKRIIIASALAVALLGCGKRESRHFVILIDVSGSIERGSLEQALKEIVELARGLHRGDRLTVIPILGDAEAGASGTIMRFDVLGNRQAYDSDLRQFAVKLEGALKELNSSAMNDPTAETDILGAISLAEQEMRPDMTNLNVLVILSDFIQEDREINFLRDGRLINKNTAKEFAKQIAKERRSRLGDTPVYLGLLKSKEYARCSRSRRYAIQEFWIEYLTSTNGAPEFVADGLGLLKKVISSR